MVPGTSRSGTGSSTSGAGISAGAGSGGTLPASRIPGTMSVDTTFGQGAGPWDPGR